MTTETKYWFLKNHQLFDALSRKEINDLTYLSIFRTGMKGEVINLPPEENRIYTLKVGKLKLVRLDSNDDEELLDVLRPGDLFGQFTLTPTDSNQYAVVLSDQVTFCSFRVHDFERILRQHPELSIRYTKMIGLRFRRLENRYSNLVHKDVRTRFRLFLKDWVQQETQPGRPVVLTNYLTHKDISRLICSTRQTITELFNEYRESGLLAYDRDRITILRPDLLNV